MCRSSLSEAEPADDRLIACPPTIKTCSGDPCIISLPEWDLQQDSDVLAHLRHHGCGCLRMELSPAARPIHALQLIHKHGPFNTADGDRQSKRVRLYLAGQWTNDRQSACSVITQICQDQGWSALCLFPSNLGVEIHENDISGVRNVRGHHSTISLPISAPSGTSAYRFSGVIWATI